MKSLLKLRLLGLLMLALLTSCKIYRDVENLNPIVSRDERQEYFDVKSLEKLVEGDQILIELKDKKIHFVIFKEIKSDILLGSIWKEDLKKLENAIPFEAPINEIESLRVKRVSAGATAGGIVFWEIILAFLYYIIRMALGDS